MSRRWASKKAIRLGRSAGSSRAASRPAARAAAPVSTTGSAASADSDSSGSAMPENPQRSLGLAEAANASRVRPLCPPAARVYAHHLPEITLIDDLDDPRIAVFRAVRERDVAGRRGGFVAEGEVVLRVLARSRLHAASSILIARKRINGLTGLLEKFSRDIPIYAAEQNVMDAIAGFAIHRGILAFGRRGPEVTAEALLNGITEPGIVLALLVFQTTTIWAAYSAMLRPLERAQCCWTPPAAILSIARRSGSPWARRWRSHFRGWGRAMTLSPY